jgi:S-DNA-T family DNA segregation ATPase FtsK/SpoIIIE
VADARGGPDVEICFRLDVPLTARDLAEAWPGDATGSLVVDGRARPDDEPLVSCGVVDGAGVTVGEPPPARAALTVVAGPLPPLTVPLTGSVLVGRGRCCDLRLEHPSVSAGHALVERTAGGWSVCRLDGEVLLDGRPVAGPRPVDVGQVISVGAVDLQLVPAEAPVTVAPPHVPVHRAARAPEAPPADAGAAPSAPPTAPPPNPPGVLTLVAPLAIGAVLAVAVHPTAGLITAAMPLLAVGSHLDDRRRHRRDERRATAAHATALDEHAARRRAADRERAAQERRRFPTAVDALVAARRGADLWRCRPEDADHDRIAVGWATDTGAPVTVSLTAGHLGIAGPLAWADATARALVLQSVTCCGPNDRGLAPGPGPWRWLPHHRSTAPALEVEVAEQVEGLSDRCAVLVVRTGDGAHLSDRTDGRRDLPVRPFVTAEDLAAEAARVMARWDDPGPAGGDLPDEVRLGSLVAAGTEDGRSALATPLGVGADGPVVVDLVADGPHALVAGTTGSGKSELLRSWVVGLARRHPPTALAFVLVDYKGGSAFDVCAGLPHVTGVVTDLDPGLGERLLVALRAEVREREGALRAAGVGDLRDLDRGPPRLVVVVDEFATLAAELPDFLGSLVDVARRGRSLGLHLVLATQRPAGVVTDDIRANTALRLCLRTLDVADSQDVLGDGSAAGLPGDRPGRAWLRRGDRIELAQIATGARPPDVERSPLRLRRVDEPWPEAPEATSSELERLVAEITTAWGDRPRPAPTWLPPLPEVIESTAGGVLGRVDRPAARCQPPLRWGPDDGHLLVVGGHRSGRTSALLTAVGGLVGERSPEALHVYAVDGGRDLAVLADLPHTGAIVPAHDRGLVRRLLGHLERPAVATLLVVDGYDALAAGCDDAEGVRLLESFDHLARSGRVTLVVGTAQPSRLPPALRATAVRLTLRLDDAADYALLGLHPPGRSLPAGRGWTADGDEVQLAVPPDLAAIVGRWDRPATGRAAPPIGPLPTVVRLPAGLGLRDRDLRPACVPTLAGRPFVVCGPTRSGRTTALATIADQLDLPVTSDPTAVPTWLARPVPQASVFDDADRLDDVGGGLRALVNARHPDAVVVVAVRADAWRSAYGTWLADLRPAADGLALRPDPTRDAELWNVGLPGVGPEPPPGRGVLVVDGRAEVIQVALR